MEKDNKDLGFKKTRLIMVITAGIVVLAFLVGTLVGANYKKDGASKDTEIKEKEDNKKEESKEEAVEESADSYMSIIERIIKYIPPHYTDVDASGLTNQEKLNIAFYIYQDDTEWNNDTMSKEDMEQMIEKVFGKDTDFEHANVVSLHDTKEVISRYDDKKGTYTYDSGSAHGFTDAVAYNYIAGNKMKNGKIEVVVKRVYYETHDVGPVTEIYKDYKMTKQIKVEEEYCDPDGLKDGYCGVLLEKYVTNHLDDITTTTYIFNVTNNYPTFVKLYE